MPRKRKSQPTVVEERERAEAEEIEKIYQAKAREMVERFCDLHHKQMCELGDNRHTPRPNGPETTPRRLGMVIVELEDEAAGALDKVKGLVDRLTPIRDPRPTCDLVPAIAENEPQMTPLVDTLTRIHRKLIGLNGLLRDLHEEIDI